MLLVWIVVLAIPSWYLLLTDKSIISQLFNLLLFPLCILCSFLLHFWYLLLGLILLPNLILVYKLSGWRNGAAFLAALGGVTILLHCYPVGIGTVRGCVKVTTDPSEVHWSKDSKLLLYTHINLKSTGYDTRLYSVNLATGYERCYRLPRATEGAGNLKISPDSKFIAFSAAHHSGLGIHRRTFYILNLKSGKIRELYSAKKLIRLRNWSQQDRIIFSIKKTDHDVGTLYAINPHIRQRPMKIGICQIKSTTLTSKPIRVNSPNGVYYYEIQIKGGGDWYNGEPDPLWLGRIVKPAADGK